MKPIQTSRIMIFFVSLALALLAVFAALFVRLEISRRRAGMEYQAFQIMTSVTEIYGIERSFDPAIWPDVSGFGVYSNSGSPVYRYGTAPASLDSGDRASSRGLTKLSGTSMTILRRMGSMASMQTAPRGRSSDQAMGPNSPMAQDMPFAGPGMMSARAKKGYVFVDINVSSLLREGRLVVAAALVLIVVFFCVISLVIVFFRKLEKYRTRERETAHLVQLGEAARTLAHEIKNPLGVIRVQCATLRRTVPEERVRNIEVIEGETARLSLLADRVRDFLKASSGTPAEYAAEFFLERCRERYAGKVSVAPAEGPSVGIFVDPDRMTQILDNLLSNAIEASQGAAELPSLTLTAHRGTVSFVVADRGSGVASENRDRLFEPFFTTKSKGSGIGLALARRFAEQAGGTVSYSPRPEGGSVFAAHLPAIKEFT